MKHWTCPSCNRDYAYHLATCSWCRVGLELREHSTASISGITEVAAGSIGHEDVPYWCALVTAADGARAIVKLDHELCVGDQVSFRAEDAAELVVVGILGTGTMGCGLAELLLSRGHRVVWCGRSVQRLDQARIRLLERLGRVMDSDEIREVASRLRTAQDYTSLTVCDVVIEAVVEDMAAKRDVLVAAEAQMRPEAILATNTSGLSIDELAESLRYPERFGVLHFFNPPTRMRLVETAISSKTSRKTSEFLDTFARVLGKIPVRVAARPAFAVNRALMPLLNEAVRELEEGVAPAESIDEAIRLGLNHPMGPLALIDLIGVDVVVKIMDNIVERTGDETYAPRPLLRKLLAMRKLGRKSGAGFYEYPR